MEQVDDDRARALESEVESLRRELNELREKELQLQLTVKEQSMMLKENDLSEEFDGNFVRLCELLDVAGEVRISAITRNTYESMIYQLFAASSVLESGFSSPCLCMRNPFTCSRNHLSIPL